MNFLHVRWLGRDLDYPAGWNKRRLHRVGFVDSEDPAAFGFLDPDQVIHGVHLIPVFAHGRTQDLLPGPSIARKIQSEDDADWRYF